MVKNTLIVGAGEAGKVVAREILDKKSLSNTYKIVGFIDDDRSKRSVFGIPVLNTITNIRDEIKKNNINLVIIAIPSADRSVINRVLENIEGVNVEVKIVPGIYEIIEGSVSWKDIRNVMPEDLLGREEVGLDIDKIEDTYKDKTVLVTGAGGSIGSSIVDHLLKLPVKRVVCLGRGENSIHSLIIKYSNDSRFSYVIGDVKDYNKIVYEFSYHKPDIVFHVAAHKHVPIMEDFPEEAVYNNVIGTYNVAIASIKTGVNSFVLISTDKAVNPSSVMGATKRIAEKIVLSLNNLKSTRFICTRFGNVLGSRGSVVPTFIEQIKRGGPITLTHPDIERFFMSIREAARLVIKAVSVRDGHIFVLNMGRPIKIIDLAKMLIKISGQDVPIMITGLRKGEKLKEEMFYAKEELFSTEFDKLMVSKNESGFFSIDEIESLISEFKGLVSNIDRDSIKKLIKKYVPEFK